MGRFEICLSGHGGQGMVLGGKILAEAIALHSDNNVVQTQSYGPEARGGASRSEIVVSDEPIDYPKITKLDLLLAFNQQSCDRYIRNLKENGILLIDPFGVKNIPKGKFRLYSISITHLAKAELGKIIYGNAIALGAICAISDIVSKESLEQVLLSYVPEKTREANKNALELGYKKGEEALKA